MSKLHELPDRRGSGTSSEPPPLVALLPYRGSRPTNPSEDYWRPLTTPLHHKRTRCGGEQRGTTVKSTGSCETADQPSIQARAATGQVCPQLPGLMSRATQARDAQSASTSNLRRSVVARLEASGKLPLSSVPIGCGRRKRSWCVRALSRRRQGSTGGTSRMTFGKVGEAKLSQWMADNARVSWIEQSEPWDLESQLISQLDLPLNQGKKK